MVADDASGTRLRLGPAWAAVLSSQSETGMGYQVVSILLKDGRRFDNVTIVDGTIFLSLGNRQPPFIEGDVAEIVVTHGRPGPWPKRS